MAQDTIKMNGIEIFQPDENMNYNLETTYTEDSTRLQTGEANFTPVFTVEQLGYTASHVPAAEAAKILQIIAKGAAFTLHYFSPYYGGWRDGVFRVGQGSLSIGTVEENKEYISTLSFNMTGDNPI